LQVDRERRNSREIIARGPFTIFAAPRQGLRIKFLIRKVPFEFDFSTFINFRRANSRNRDASAI
jgi:hypothetical protein